MLFKVEHKNKLADINFETSIPRHTLICICICICIRICICISYMYMERIIWNALATAVSRRPAPDAGTVFLLPCERPTQLTPSNPDSRLICFRRPTLLLVDCEAPLSRHGCLRRHINCHCYYYKSLKLDCRDVTFLPKASYA